MAHNVPSSQSNEGLPMKVNSRRIAVTLAALSLAGLLSACGAVGQAVDCNAVSNEVTKISTEFSTAAAGGAADPEVFNKAGEDAAKKAKALASKYDGELGAALNDFATAFEGMKLDPANPAGLMESVNKLQGFSTKITAACS